MACSDMCRQYKATRTFGGSRYASGQKYCKTCAMFIRWDGVRCPCCGLQMKSSNRHLQYKTEIKRI